MVLLSTWNSRLQTRLSARFQTIARLPIIGHRIISITRYGYCRAEATPNKLTTITAHRDVSRVCNSGRSAGFQLLCTAADNSVFQGSRYGIRHRNQYGPQQQRCARMNLTENKQLRNHIKDYGDGDYVADRYDCTSPQSAPVGAVEDQPQKKRGMSCSRVSFTVPQSQEDCNCRLHDEPQAPWSRETCPQV